MKHMNMYFYPSGLMLRRRIKRVIRVSFQMTTPYYRSMDVFNRIRSLFLLTLVTNIISSMLLG
jgi:hypothetical protein